MLDQIKRSLLERVSFGANISSALRDAIAEYKPSDFAELAVLAHRIDACNDEANHWLATDLHRDDGELYDGGGRFWYCGSKLCPSCLAKQARRNRSHLRDAISRQRLLTGEHLFFVTFTMPTLEGVSLLDARRVMNRAWSLFRKRTFWKKLVIGGCKSEEFTIRPKGFHYHMHQILRMRWAPAATFKHHWTECLQAAALAELGRTITLATANGLAVINMKRITSMDAAIKEVAKYVTSTTELAKVDGATLLDLARVRRFPRMFELFGSFARLVPRSVRSRASLEVSTISDRELVDIDTYLDNESISDEQLAERSWRGRVRRRGASEYLAELHQRITECTDIRKNQLKRKYHAASFKQIAGKRPPLVPRTLAFIEQIASTRQRSHIGVLIKLDSGEFRYEHQDGTVEWLDAKRDALRLNSLAMQTLANRSRVTSCQA